MNESNNITASQAYNALDAMDDYTRMEMSMVGSGALNVLFQFIQEHTKDAILDEDGERSKQFLECVCGDDIIDPKTGRRAN